MVHSALTPVFVGLRTGLHLLFAALTALVIARALLVPTDHRAATIILAVALGVTYVGGALRASGALRAGTQRAGGPSRRILALVWLALLTIEWAALLWLSSEAAYLAFPLFFLYVHLLGPGWGSLAIGVAALAVIVALGVHSGWSVGGVIGPLVGAAVALLISLGYRALAHEAAEREALVRELLDTRDQLAASEHESGILAERSRLAREIHDTVAQGLSSIQMLLHAAEQADPDRPGVDHLRLARQTAASNLADTRRFIRELTPPDLDEHGLGSALRRLAESQWSTHGVAVSVEVSDDAEIPMHVQSALLRIAQGAIANVIQHARARTATITLAREPGALRFTIADDGEGFDPERPTDASPSGTGSFGIIASRERVEQLGGTLRVESAPGAGTVVDVVLPQGDAS